MRPLSPLSFNHLFTVCVQGLAAPTALLVGSGLAAKYGILARGGGEAFQEMAQVDLVVFDKTGTLTEGGEPRVSDADILSSRWERKTILGIAAELESTSSHPLGRAITAHCKAEDATAISGSMFEETSGRGLKAHFEELHCTAVIGNEAWLEDHGVIIDGGTSQRLETWKSEAKSVVVLAIRDEASDGAASKFELVAIFAIADQVRFEARSVVTLLQHEGIGTWMISGDNVKTAEAVAQSVGIPQTNVIAGVLPHEKVGRFSFVQPLESTSSRRTYRRRRYSGCNRLARRGSPSVGAKSLDLSH